MLQKIEELFDETRQSVGCTASYPTEVLLSKHLGYLTDETLQKIYEELKDSNLQHFSTIAYSLRRKGLLSVPAHMVINKLGEACLMLSCNRYIKFVDDDYFVLTTHPDEGMYLHRSDVSLKEIRKSLGCNVYTDSTLYKMLYYWALIECGCKDATFRVHLETEPNVLFEFVHQVCKIHYGEDTECLTISDFEALCKPNVHSELFEVDNDNDKHYVYCSKGLHGDILRFVVVNEGECIAVYVQLLHKGVVYEYKYELPMFLTGVDSLVCCEGCRRACHPVLEFGDVFKCALRYTINSLGFKVDYDNIDLSGTELYGKRCIRFFNASDYIGSVRQEEFEWE